MSDICSLLCYQSIGQKVFTKAKVLDKKYLLKLHNVFQTSSKRFVKSPPICLLMSDICSLLCLKIYSLIYAIAIVLKRLLRLSEFVILVLH